MNKDGFAMFLRSQNFYVKEPPYTHLLMNGGKLRVPKEKKEQFMLAYAHHVNVSKLYVIELKTPIFKLFLLPNIIIQ